MQYSRETVNELNQLSKAVFGSTSKWRKMVEKGVWELLEEDVKKLTMKDGKEEYKIVKSPVLHKEQMNQYVLHRYTVEEAKDFLLKVLVKRQEIQQAIDKAKAQKKAEEAAKERASEAAGSAV